jgi:UDP-N-acetylmuramate dehydrogenase
MLARIAGAVRFKEPLSFHTSLRIGGPAEFFVVPRDLEDVRYAMAFAHQEGLPVVVMGAGNSLLVADQGLQAMVLKLGGVFGRVEFHGDELAAGAGVGLSELIRQAAARDLGGLECLAGIPASVGGALAANVGTREGAIGEFCAAVYFVLPDGTLAECRPQSHAGTRTPDLPAGAIVAGCRMQLMRRPAATIQKDIQQRLRRRRASQPFALACAGYIWKNPPGQIAERLIDACGMRGKRINDAEVSSKCSNLIVNRSAATAADVLALMDMTRERVEAKFGVVLQPDLTMLGFPGGPVVQRAPLEMAGVH